SEPGVIPVGSARLDVCPPRPAPPGRPAVSRADDAPHEEPSPTTGPMPTATGGIPTVTGSMPTITGAIPVLEDEADHDLAHLPGEQALRGTRGKVTAIAIVVLTTLSAIGPLATDMYIPAFPEGRASCREGEEIGEDDVTV